ncbi:MAG TPA: glycosyltransferase [Baekduia sp.]|uniref:glycosyltransferase n=1 Tax=Baekduia sp. TaxID=2600305 RepID=UPI002D76A803|nr:glycosyltransferase [Baekduia sp.]HET6508482.1 glycosyltransferase [Baekduia sp.]
MPEVSIVIPVKGNQRTIGATVASIAAQDHDGDVELILVGDHGDPTWQAVPGDRIGRVTVKRLEITVDTGGRDANAKRNAGLAAATGDVLCLTDSDMVLPTDWLRTGLALLDGETDCVGGPMISVHRDFWGAYVDGNPIASKTPRMPEPYRLDRASLGRRGRKLPITANVLLTREVYEAVGGLDAAFVHSYEDYEFFQRIVDAGFAVVCDPTLAAWHHHRQGWRALVREYHRSGRGCAQFVGKHPHSPFSRDRMRQLEIVATVALFGLVACVEQPVALLAGLALAALLCLYVTARARTPRAVVFPAVTLVLGLSFTAGLVRGLRTRPASAPAGSIKEDPSWSPVS